MREQSKIKFVMVRLLKHVMRKKNEPFTDVKDVSDVFTRIEGYIQEGNYSEALKLVEMIEEEVNFSSEKQVTWYILKSMIFIKLGRLEEALSLAERALSESIRLDMPLLMVDAMLAAAESSWKNGNHDKSSSFLEKARLVLDDQSSHEKMGMEEIDKRRALIQYHESAILMKEGNYDQALPCARDCLVKLRKFDEQKSIADVLHLIGAIYHNKGDLDRALEHYQESLEYRKKLGNDQDLATTLHNMGMLLSRKGDLDAALIHYQQSLDLRKNIGNKRDLANTLNNIGVVYYKKGDLTQALTYYQESLALLEQLNLKLQATLTLNNIGAIHHQKGLLDQALKYYQKSLASLKELNLRQWIAILLHNIGLVYHQKDELDHSMNYLLESLALKEEIGNQVLLAETIFYIILVLLDKDQVELAKDYWERLQQLASREKNPVLRQQSRLAEALFLKADGSPRNRGKAEMILQYVSEEEVVDHELTVMALLNWCELLVIELQESNDPEVLKKLAEVIHELQEIAIEQHSHWLTAELYWLQAKIALLQSRDDDARRLLTRAQNHAEKHGLQLLAQRISQEHDELLSRIGELGALRQQLTSMSEKIEITGVDRLVRAMVRRKFEKTSLNTETPVMLLIMTDSGLPFLTVYFQESDQVNEVLFSGFVSAVMSFSNEMFSGSLDRLKIGDLTVAINNFDNFLFCYAFKGATYFALKALEAFVTNIQSLSSLREAMTSFNVTGIEPPEVIKNQLITMANQTFIK